MSGTNTDGICIRVDLMGGCIELVLLLFASKEASINELLDVLLIRLIAA